MAIVLDFPLPSWIRSKTRGTPAKNVGLSSTRSSLISLISFNGQTRYIRYKSPHTERQKILETYPMIVANRGALVEEILFNHSIKNVSKRQERYVHIIHSHLYMYTSRINHFSTLMRAQMKKIKVALTLSSNCSMKRSTPRMLVETFSCVKMTPLGSPLVPLVYMIVHMLDGFGGDISTGFSFPCSRKENHVYPTPTH